MVPGWPDVVQVGDYSNIREVGGRRFNHRVHVFKRTPRLLVCAVLQPILRTPDWIKGGRLSVDTKGCLIVKR
jgi:hypothetical protein